MSNEPYTGWRRKGFNYQDPRKVLQNLVQNTFLTPREALLPTPLALDYRLSRDVVASRDRPEHDLSHVDGYAIRASDAGPGRCLKRVKGVDPRAAQVYELGPGEAVYVDTGFPLPRGADAVVPVEEARLVEGGDCIEVDGARRGENVIPRGIDYRKGQVLARRGERITGAHVRLLLDAGFAGVWVYERPRIALLPIGDELAPPPRSPGEEPPGGGRVWESSSFLVRGLLSHLPVEVEVLDIVEDRGEAIVERVRGLVEEGRHNIIATIGGASLGRKDKTWESLRESLRPRYSYRGIRVVQGRVNSGMALDRAIVLNLPGFVQSTFTGTVLILAPLANWLSGGPLDPQYPCFQAPLAEELHLGGKRREFYKMRFAYLHSSGKGVVVEPHVESSMVTPITSSLGFTLIPPGVEKLERGTPITIYDPLWRKGRVDCPQGPLGPIEIPSKD